MAPKWMLRNSNDESSGSFTFAAISFAVVTLCVLLSPVGSITLGKIIITFRPIDTTLALGYLAASFSTYVVRRTTRDSAEECPPKT